MSNLGDTELQSLLNTMSQSQLMQLFGGGSGLTSTSSGSTRQRSNAGGNASSGASVTAASSTATTTTTSSSSNAAGSKPGDSANIRLSDLQNVLSGLPSAGSSGPSVDLSSGLTSEVLAPLLENPEFVKKMKELLPDEEQQQEDVGGQVQSTLHSPQFRQALGMFSSGLQTGQLAPLIREFNLGEAAIEAATKGDMEAFVKALQNNKKSPAKESGDKKEDDDGMALD